MQIERGIFKNTLSLMLGKIFGDLATFFFLVYFARIFGISIFGQYAFAMSLGGFLSILVNLGLNTLVIREISKNKKNDAKYIGNMLATQCVLAILSWSLIAVFVSLSNFDSDTGLIILIIGSYQVLFKLTQLINSRFKAHEDMEYSASLDVYHKVVILLVGSSSIALWQSPVITLLVYPISALSMLLVGIIISNRKYGRPDFRVDLVFIKELLFKALPFLILTMLAQFYDRIGIVLLTSYRGADATGIYALSDRFLITISAGIGMFGSALFPAMSRLAHQSKQKLIVTYDRSVRIIMVTTLPIATFLYLLSEPIILFIYGEEFIESASVLKVLSWVILPSGLSAILTNVLVATDQQRQVAKTQLMIFSGYFIACLIILPLFSYVGLAYAKLVSGSALCLAYLWNISRMLRSSPILDTFKSPFIGCLAAIIVFKLMSNSTLWVSAPAAILAFLCALAITGGIKRHDLAFVLSIILDKRT